MGRALITLLPYNFPGGFSDQRKTPLIAPAGLQHICPCRSPRTRQTCCCQSAVRAVDDKVRSSRRHRRPEKIPFDGPAICRQRIMSIDETEEFGNSRIESSLASRINGRADAVQIADEIVTMFQEISDALSPIIGRRGFYALYKRSLHLAAPAYPWLSVARDGTQDFLDPAKLKSTFVAQSPASAAAGGSVLLQTFQDLLASLIGASLTKRLLHPVWIHSSGIPPAQELSP